jgi:hypothetical protein
MPPWKAPHRSPSSPAIVIQLFVHFHTYIEICVNVNQLQCSSSHRDVVAGDEFPNTVLNMGGYSDGGNEVAERHFILILLDLY